MVYVSFGLKICLSFQTRVCIYVCWDNCLQEKNTKCDPPPTSFNLGSCFFVFLFFPFIFKVSSCSWQIGFGLQQGLGMTVETVRGAGDIQLNSSASSWFYSLPWLGGRSLIEPGWWKLCPQLSSLCQSICTRRVCGSPIPWRLTYILGT